jgi:hypothetical protein
MSLSLCKTDGGRLSSGFAHEKKDCTVRSFAVAVDVPYPVAHDVAKRSGRPDKKGWWPEKILRVAQQDGLVEFVPVPVGARSVQQYSRMHGFITRIKYPTLTDVARRYKKGRYILSTRNHATALIDGQIHDTGLRPGARILEIFEVRPVAPVAVITQSQINELWARLDALEAR